MILLKIREAIEVHEVLIQYEYAYRIQKFPRRNHSYNSYEVCVIDMLVFCI